MKKVLFSVAVVAAFGLASCGGPDFCECMEADKDDKELNEKCEEAYGELEKDELKEKAKECKSDEEGEDKE